MIVTLNLSNVSETKKIDLSNVFRLVISETLKKHYEMLTKSNQYLNFLYFTGRNFVKKLPLCKYSLVSVAV